MLTRMCIQLLDNRSGAYAEQLKVYNNTCFRDNLYDCDWMDGEININAASGSVASGRVTIYNNIAYQPLSAQLSEARRYAAWCFFRTSASAVR